MATVDAGAAPKKPGDLERDAAALRAAVAELVRVYQFRDRDRICCHDGSGLHKRITDGLIEQQQQLLEDLDADVRGGGRQCDPPARARGRLAFPFRRIGRPGRLLRPWNG
jgi:hypothetical protein